MSFSAEVKMELAKHESGSRHCKIAELSAILYECGRCHMTKEHFSLILQSENEDLVTKFRHLLQELFQIFVSEDEVRASQQNGMFRVTLSGSERVLKILQATRFQQPQEYFEVFEDRFLGKNQTLHYDFSEKEIKMGEMKFSELLIRDACCRRAFLRGCFLASGSMSDPEKNYHLEFVCAYEKQAQLILKVIASFEIEAKMVLRKKYYVVYIKEGESIVDLLNVMEAHVSLMSFENLRILKEMRNSINRRVNCEAANITKTVNAASRQVESIMFIKEHGGLKQLPVQLLEMAELRLENPDLPLKELGALLDPPVGKSGVNHRLRKIGEIADKLRDHSIDE